MVGGWDSLGGGIEARDYGDLLEGDLGNGRTSRLDILLSDRPCGLGRVTSPFDSVSPFCK